MNTNGKGTGVKLVIFQLGVDLFAADVLSVDRVLRYSPPNSVPDVPKWVEGVTEHRGEVIPVIDLRRRIELAEATITPETRILVLNASNGRVGAIVDAVLEVAVVPAESMSPPPALFKGVATDVMRAVTKVRDQLVVVLDVDRVMWNADRIVVEHGAQDWGVGGGDRRLTEAVLDGLRARRALLAARLEEPEAGAKLDALKADIGALFKMVDAEYRELGALREEVLALVEKWKGVRANGNGVAPHLDGAKPAVHSDHLGASTYVEKGWHKISAGEYAEADACLTKALELSPGDPQAESLLGWSLMLQDRYDDALLSFQRVLVREPMNALARVNLGYICLKKRIFGEAIEHLSRAIRLDNDKKATLYAHFYLGLVYLEREMFEDAQTFFQKTLALGPNLVEAYFELGRAYWFNSQRDEATSTWQAGFAANKFNPWGKRCVEAIETVAAGGVP